MFSHSCERIERETDILKPWEELDCIAHMNTFCSMRRVVGIEWPWILWKNYNADNDDPVTDGALLEENSNKFVGKYFEHLQINITFI